VRSEKKKIPIFNTWRKKKGKEETLRGESVHGGGGREKRGVRPLFVGRISLTKG